MNRRVETSGDDGHVDEGTVHAWLDGQLSAADAARVEAHVAGCRACAALVAEARGHVAAATRILTALDGVPAKVAPRAQSRVRRWHFRAAAAIVVMALGTAVVVRGPRRAALRSAYEQPAAAVVRRVPDSNPLALRPDSVSQDHTAGPVAKSQASGASRVPDEARPPAPHAMSPHAMSPHGTTPGAMALAPQRPHPLDLGAEARRGLAQMKAAPGLPQAETSDLASREAAVPPAAASPPADRDAVTSPLLGTAAPLAPGAGPAMAESGVRVVTGQVIDSGGRVPVSAAAVIVPGTTIGQNTTDSGTFTLAVPRDAKSLTVRRIGYVAQTVPLSPGQTTYTVPLKKDVLHLETQVVSGAATSASSQTSANAASRLSSQPIERVPAPTIENSLQGAVAGVGVVGGNANGLSVASELTAGRTTCRDRVVRVPTMPASDAVTPDSAVDYVSGRLSGVPVAAPGPPGYVVRAVPDTAASPLGHWEPIGRDSALVSIPGPGGDVVQQRVSCGGR